MVGWQLDPCPGPKSKGTDVYLLVDHGSAHYADSLMLPERTGDISAPATGDSGK